MASPLTPSQISIIKSTAPVLQVHGEAITTLFYADLLASTPSLKNMFNITSQTTGRQPRALAGAVLAYATYIDDLPKLSAAVELIAHKHASLQVSPEMYDLVGKGLILAIGEVLGDAATREIVEAWTKAYAVLAGVFIGREKEMYALQREHGWEGWRKFTVARKVEEADGVVSFYFEPKDGSASGKLPAYLPGQFVSVQVFVPELGFLQSRQYSLSQAPDNEGRYYRVSVKKEAGEIVDHPGLVSNLLHDGFVVGDEVELSHPQGDFFVDTSDKTKEGVPAVLISAGVGATPMMAILGALDLAAEETKRRPVSWIQGARSRAALLFADAVSEVCARNEGVRANVFLTTVGEGDMAGVDYHFGATRIDLDRLDGERDLYLGDKRAEYFVCGPELFMVQMRRALLAKGVDEERIRLEVFQTGGVGAA